MITSLPPFTTSVGWRIDFRYANGFSCGEPHLPIAPLPRADPLANFGISVHLAEMLALQELQPCSLSLLGRTE